MSEELKNNEDNNKPGDENNTQPSGNEKAAEKPKKKKTIFRKIVNVFLYFFLFLVVLILLVLGFTQTSTFREILREQVVSIANEELNGNLAIGKIDGTIFTSLIIRDISINIEKDTVVKAGVVEIRLSPLKLLMKNLYFRKIDVHDVRLNLAADSNGVLNLTKLFPEKTEEDTTESKLPFTIEVADMKLHKTYLVMQNYENIGSKSFYETLNMDDFRARDVTVNLTAFADVNNDRFDIDLKEISFNPNVNNFNLEKLSGIIKVDTNGVLIDDMLMKTKNSEILLNAKASNYNVFDTLADYKKADLVLSLVADKFNFADAAALTPSMNQMKGSIYAKFEAKGTLENLILDLVQLDYENSHIITKGSVKNLLDPDKIYIKTDLTGSYINQADIKTLMPSLGVPVYKDYGVLYFDTLYYEGRPLNFKTTMFLKTDQGTFYANGKMDLEPKHMVYDFGFKADRLDLTAFAGDQLVLNASGFVKGSGITPNYINANLDLTADGTIYNGNTFSNLDIIAKAADKIINYEVFANKDTTTLNIDGFVDYKDDKNPAYTLNGLVERLDIQDFSDSSMATNLNLQLNAEGRSFDPDNMDLYMTMNIFDSEINGKHLDSTRAIVDLRKGDGENSKIINLISDIADITVAGDFSIEQLSNLFAAESKLLNSVIKQKLGTIVPGLQDTIETINKDVVKTTKKTVDEKKKDTAQTDSTINIDYLIEFKDFTLASIFLGENHVEIAGEMGGNLIANGDSVQLTYNTTLDYLKYWGPEDVFFVSKFNLDFTLNNDLGSENVEDVYADLKLTTQRIFAGTDIRDIDFNLRLDRNASSISAYAMLENYASISMLGGFTFDNQNLNLVLDSLNMTYNDIKVHNIDKIDIGYGKDRIDIRQLVLGNSYGNLAVKGIVSTTGENDLSISINDFTASMIGTNFLSLRPENNFAAIINMDTRITGNFMSPLMSVDLVVDSITYKNRNFGRLVSKIDYANENLNLDFRFLDTTINADQPALLLTGVMPINLALSGEVKERMINSRNIDLVLQSENFNLGALGDLAPGVNKLRGFFNSNIKIGGTYEKINPAGFINFKEAGFVVEANNLEYDFALNANIYNRSLTIDTLLLSNVNVENGGTLFGRGSAVFDEEFISDFTLTGDLKILDEVSRTAGIGAYGELVIATKGEVRFTSDGKRMILEAPILIKTADVTIPPTQGAYENQNPQFVYKFVSDSAERPVPVLDFDQLIEISKKQQEKVVTKKSGSTASTFDYIIDLSIEDEARFNFVLSKELNQVLTAVLNGNIDFQNVKGVQSAQGEFKLLEGSTLEFIKSFVADGSVRFEREIANPYLDITATYRAYYEVGSDTTSSSGIEEEEAAVKIKLKGPLKELDKNFIQQEDNIAVYFGEEDIENDVPDRSKDASDALMFIATNKFKEDLNQSERTAAANQFSSAATSLAGSVLGGVLNSYFGTYVRSVELRQVGTETRFNLTGKFMDFKYTVGGSTKAFEDISQANIRLEYPLLRDLLIRVERREDLTETGVRNEMVNELGIRYKFEF